MARTANLVLMPRYSTFSGQDVYTTLPVQVTDYDSVEIYAWRGPNVTSATFTFALEESLDRETWNHLAGGDPGASTEATYTADLTLPWLRGKITLGGGGSVFPIITCYAVGLLVKRR